MTSFGPETTGGGSGERLRPPREPNAPSTRQVARTAATAEPMPIAHSRGRASWVGGSGDVTNELSSVGCPHGRSRGFGGGPLGTSSGSGVPSPPSSGHMARSVPMPPRRSRSPLASASGGAKRRRRASLHYHGNVQPPATGDWIAVAEDALPVDAATQWATTPGSGAVVV